MTGQLIFGAETAAAKTATVPFLTGTPKQLEIGVTHRKQSPRLVSNRDTNTGRSARDKRDFRGAGVSGFRSSIDPTEAPTSVCSAAYRSLCRQLRPSVLRHHVFGVPVWPVRVALPGALFVLTVSGFGTPKCARQIFGRREGRRRGVDAPGKP